MLSHCFKWSNQNSAWFFFSLCGQINLKYTCVSLKEKGALTSLFWISSDNCKPLLWYCPALYVRSLSVNEVQTELKERILFGSHFTGVIEMNEWFYIRPIQCLTHLDRPHGMTWWRFSFLCWHISFWNKLLKWSYSLSTTIPASFQSLRLHDPLGQL